MQNMSMEQQQQQQPVDGLCQTTIASPSVPRDRDANIVMKIFAPSTSICQSPTPSPSHSHNMSTVSSEPPVLARAKAETMTLALRTKRANNSSSMSVGTEDELVADIQSQDIKPSQSNMSDRTRQQVRFASEPKPMLPNSRPATRPPTPVLAALTMNKALPGYQSIGAFPHRSRVAEPSPASFAAYEARKSPEEALTGTPETTGLSPSNLPSPYFHKRGGLNTAPDAQPAFSNTPTGSRAAYVIADRARYANNSRWSPWGRKLEVQHIERQEPVPQLSEDGRASSTPSEYGDVDLVTHSPSLSYVSTPQYHSKPDHSFVCYYCDPAIILPTTEPHKCSLRPVFEAEYDSNSLLKHGYALNGPVTQPEEWPPTPPARTMSQLDSDPELSHQGLGYLDTIFRSDGTLVDHIPHGQSYTNERLKKTRIESYSSVSPWHTTCTVQATEPEKRQQSLADDDPKEHAEKQKSRPGGTWSPELKKYRENLERHVRGREMQAGTEISGSELSWRERKIIMGIAAPMTSKDPELKVRGPKKVGRRSRQYSDDVNRDSQSRRKAKPSEPRKSEACVAGEPDSVLGPDFKRQRPAKERRSASAFPKVFPLSDSHVNEAFRAHETAVPLTKLLCRPNPSELEQNPITLASKTSPPSEHDIEALHAQLTAPRRRTAKPEQNTVNPAPEKCLVSNPDFEPTAREILPLTTPWDRTRQGFTGFESLLRGKTSTSEEKGKMPATQSTITTSSSTSTSTSAPSYTLPKKVDPHAPPSPHLIPDPIPCSATSWNTPAALPSFENVPISSPAADSPASKPGDEDWLYVDEESEMREEWEIVEKSNTSSGGM